MSTVSELGGQGPTTSWQEHQLKAWLCCADRCSRTPDDGHDWCAFHLAELRSGNRKVPAPEDTWY